MALLVAAACTLAAQAQAQAQVGVGAAPPAPFSDAAPPAPPTDAAPGSLRQQVEGALAGPPVPATDRTRGPAWIITPGISLLQEWTDNTTQAASDRHASLITVVSPSISINGSTSRLTANLFYAPSISLYTPASSQDQLGQNLATDALLEVLPGVFYVKAAGFAATQSISGAIASNGTTALTKSDSAQTYSFSIEPYLTHRFGGWGTAQIGVLASESREFALSGGGPAIQSLSTRQETATFKSGENFGRLSHTVTLSATQDNGTGALQGATNDQAAYQIGYAITHGIIALASIGWEDIRYAGVGAPRYNDATWSVGTQLTPNPDSLIALSYGHQNGATAAAVNASYAPTASIRLSAQYSAGVTTATQALGAALAGTTFDAFGHPIDTATGAPVALTNNFFGFNGTVYQARNLSVSAAWLRPRDTFQFTLSRQTQTPVGGSTGTLLAANGNLPFGAGLAATSGTFGTLSWQHDFSPVLASTTSLQYGVLHNATPVTLTNGVLTSTGNQVQNARLVAVTTELNWQMSRTLTGSVQYSYTNNDYSIGNPGVTANLAIIGLRKTF